MRMSQERGAWRSMSGDNELKINGPKLHGGALRGNPLLRNSIPEACDKLMVSDPKFWDIQLPQVHRHCRAL